MPTAAYNAKPSRDPKPITPQQYRENAAQKDHGSETTTLRSLDDAIRILNAARRQLAKGSVTIWLTVDHACKHLESEIDALLRQ